MHHEGMNFIHIDFEYGQYPVIKMLIKAIHLFIQINYEFSRSTLIHLIGAITKIYEFNEVDVRRDIIQQIESHRVHSNLSTVLINFFSEIVLGQELKLANFRGTEVFMKFLCKIIKNPYPMDCVI